MPDHAICRWSEYVLGTASTRKKAILVFRYWAQRTARRQGQDTPKTSWEYLFSIPMSLIRSSLDRYARA